MKIRESISAKERNAVTFWYCVTENAQVTIASSYRISRSTVCRIITETSDAIWTVFMREKWKEISHSFENK